MAETDTRVLEFLEEGLFLYGVGKVQEAIQRWRKVLELDPRNERALDYIESAGGDVSAYRKNVPAPPPVAPPMPSPVPSSFLPDPPTVTQPSIAAAPVTQPGIPSPPIDPFAGFGSPMPATQVPNTSFPSAPTPSRVTANPMPPAPPSRPPPPPMPPAPVFSTPMPTPTAPTPAAPPPRAPMPPVPPAMPARETRDDLLLKAGALYRAQQYDLALEILERVVREFPPLDDTIRGYMDATRTGLLQSLRGQWTRMDQVPRPRMSPQQVMQLKLTPEAGFLLSRIDGMSTLEDILSVAGIEELTALRALSALVQNGVIELA